MEEEKFDFFLKYPISPHPTKDDEGGEGVHVQVYDECVQVDVHVQTPVNGEGADVAKADDGGGDVHVQVDEEAELAKEIGPAVGPMEKEGVFVAQEEYFAHGSPITSYSTRCSSLVFTAILISILLPSNSLVNMLCLHSDRCLGILPFLGYVGNINELDFCNTVFVLIIQGTDFLSI